MTTRETLALLESHRLIMVSRSHSRAEALRTIEAAREGGVRAIEVTFTVPDAELVIAELAEESDSGLLIGAGSVLTIDHARAAIDAGATFLVSPGFDEDIFGFATGAGALMVPGVLTPTEAMRATALGATVLKLFPAATAGPAFLAALLAPMPNLKVIPSGGISSSSAASWIDSGAIAVGIGGLLSPAYASDEQSLRRVRNEAEAAKAAVHSVKKDRAVTTMERYEKS